MLSLSMMVGTRNNQRGKTGWSAVAAPLLLLAAFAVMLIGSMPFLPASGTWLRPTIALGLVLIGLACSRHQFSQVRVSRSVWAVLALLGLLLVLWAVRGERGLSWFGNPDTPQLSSALLLLCGVVLLSLLLSQKHRVVDALPIVLAGGLSVWSAVVAVSSLSPSVFLRVLQLFQTTPTTVAVLGVMAALILLALLVFSPFAPLWRIACVVGVGADIFLILRMDRPLAWGLLSMGTIVILAVAVRRFQEVSVRMTTAAFTLCALALLATFVRPPEPIRAQVPAEVGIQHRLTMQIVTKAMAAHPGSIAWGFGPDAFVRLFAAYRGSSWNETPLWNVRFAEPSSVGWQLLTGWGMPAVLGVSVLLVWCMLVGVPLALAGQWKGTRKTFVRRAGYGSDMQPTAVGVLAALVAGIIACLLSSVGAPVIMLLAIFAGWFLRQGALEGVAETPRARMIGLWVVVACLLAAGACGVAAVQTGRTEQQLQKVLRMEHGVATPMYQWLVAQATNSTDPRTLRLVTWKLSKIVTADERDVLLTAARHAVSVRGDIRTLDQAIVALLQVGADGMEAPELGDWVAQAHAAEPDSPVWPFVTGQLVDVSDPAKAEAAYRAAYALKPDYVPNTRALALLLERTGRGEEGLALMESLRVAIPYDDAVLLALSAMLMRRNADGDVARVAALLKTQAELPNASAVLKQEYTNFLHFIGATSSTPSLVE